MKKVVFDIETKNEFLPGGKIDPLTLDLSVVCIYDSETDSYDTFFEEELPRLWPILEKTDMLIGYNSDHFDIPLLNKYYPGDLMHIKSLDLLKEIKQSLGKRLKLDSIAKATLGKGKSAHGLQAVEWWKNGEVEKVKQYCLEDVKITKELYDYAKEHGILKYRDFDQIREVKLDTSAWEQQEKSSLTHTLPF